MGPYVIQDISTSGALRLATIDGEQMPNWISGCRVKKYLEPLTLEMLERMHKAKERARASDQKKHTAIAEAKPKQAKNQKQGRTSMNPRVMQIKGKSLTNDLSPQIRVEVGSLGIPATALIDTGAEVSTISYEIWTQLGKPHLKPHKYHINRFFRTGNKDIGSMSIACLHLWIQMRS